LRHHATFRIGRYHHLFGHFLVTSNVSLLGLVGIVATQQAAARRQTKSERGTDDGEKKVFHFRQHPTHPPPGFNQKMPPA
jgi:hypothetical protein